MKQLTILILILCLGTACTEDEALTGSVRLVFSGTNVDELKINIYPGEIFTVEDLIRTQPLIKDLQPINGVVTVSGYNPGNYTWYDGGRQIGFFQITAGQTRTFDISIW